jgi:hypothetical protein
MADVTREAVGRARADLAARLGISAAEVSEEAVEAADFPNAALGAPTAGTSSTAPRAVSSGSLTSTARTIGFREKVLPGTQRSKQ